MEALKGKCRQLRIQLAEMQKYKGKCVKLEAKVKKLRDENYQLKRTLKSVRDMVQNKLYKDCSSKSSSSLSLSSSDFASHNVNIAVDTQSPVLGHAPNIKLIVKNQTEDQEDNAWMYENGQASQWERHIEQMQQREEELQRKKQMKTELSSSSTASESEFNRKPKCRPTDLM